MTAIDKFGLPGKVAVVTGGARGIGYAVASLSASVGADIAIIDILEEVGAASARDLAASSRKKVRFYRADLRDPAQALEAATRVESDFGRVDVLFNCIGVNPNTDFLEIPSDEWTNVISVNVNGQFFIAQAFARQMARRGGGSIVAIG